MGVADQRDPLLLDVQAVFGQVHVDDVLPDRVPGGGVVETETFAAVACVAAQPLQRVGGSVAQLSAGPEGGFGSAGAEGRDVDLAECSQIVVADQPDRAAVGEDLEAFVRAGPVSDCVSETPDLVAADLIDPGQDRFQGGEVRVDVGDDCRFHFRMRPQGGGAGRGAGRGLLS